MSTIQYVSTALPDMNKAGKLKRDEHGYYEIVLGGLNVINSSGALYVMEGARALLDKSNLLNKRIQSQRLRAEYGHPKRQPGQSEDEFFSRILNIEEKNVCSHIREFRLEPRQGSEEILIIGWVKPSGPFGPALEESLNNPNENVCYSIRSFTDDHQHGYTRKKILKTVVTWDYVNDPGIHFANKLDTPSLEELNSQYFTRNTVERALKEAKEGGPSMENMFMSATELLRALGQRPLTQPPAARW